MIIKRKHSCVGCDQILYNMRENSKEEVHLLEKRYEHVCFGVSLVRMEKEKILLSVSKKNETKDDDDLKIESDAYDMVRG